MAQLYRKSALERISSPEQLDKALTITSPMSWIVLAAFTVVIVITIIWSIVGTLPETVTTSGIVSSPVSTNAIYSTEPGTVLSVNVFAGSKIEIGDTVLTYKTGNGDVNNLVSDQVGTVTNISVKTGDSINQGSEAVRVSPSVSNSQVVVCYVKISDAKKITRGMKANISLTSADSQTYGHMVGQVINIDSRPSTTAGMAYVLGSDNNLAAQFQKDGTAVVAVTMEIGADAETTSGYWWSNVKGKSLAVTNGTLVDAKIITKEVRPITKLFSKLKDIWGE